METTGKLNAEIESHLKTHCKKNGWTPSKEIYTEILLEAKRIWTEIGASHRWYNEKYVVVEIDGKLIGYAGYHLTGDNNASDMGLQFDLSNVEFCEEYQETITKYRPIATPALH